MSDPLTPPLSSFFLSDDEQEAIALALQQGNPWNHEAPDLNPVKEFLISVKERLRDLHMQRQKHTCCYCKTNLFGGEAFFIDREHILPKGKFKQFTYEPMNISVACKRCNMSYKKSRIDFVVKELLDAGGHYRKSYCYKFVHPNLDKWTDHLSRTSQQVDESVLVKYSINSESDKGTYTYQYFRLDRLEVDSFDEAQGANILDKSAMEQKLDLEKMVGHDIP